MQRRGVKGIILKSAGFRAVQNHL